MAKKPASSPSKTANAAYTEAAPYLLSSEWLREILDTGLRKAETVDALLAFLEKERQRETDMAKQTDLRIYLAYLRKLGPKS